MPAYIPTSGKSDSRTSSSQRPARWRTVDWLLSSLICLCSLAAPHSLFAVNWPWKKSPDVVKAACTVEPNQVVQGSMTLLHAKIAATDSRSHPLSYAWSGNAGKIIGSGPKVQLDLSGVNPGVYRIQGIAQDTRRHRATCTMTVHVVPAADMVSVKSCTAAPAVVEQGKPAVLKAEASDTRGHRLHYSWFTNGGKLEGKGAQVKLDTAGLRPGVYTVTTRVEDDWGSASDCNATVKVKLPPPPPAPPQPSNIAEIVFARNRDVLEPKTRIPLQRVLLRLKNNPKGRISIESYAGPDEHAPQRLAAKRAAAVKRYLMENGVNRSRLRTVVGLGGRLGGLRNRTTDIIWLPDGLDY